MKVTSGDTAGSQLEWARIWIESSECVAIYKVRVWTDKTTVAICPNNIQFFREPCHWICNFPPVSASRGDQESFRAWLKIPRISLLDEFNYVWILGSSTAAENTITNQLLDLHQQSEFRGLQEYVSRDLKLDILLLPSHENIRHTYTTNDNYFLWQ